MQASTKAGSHPTFSLLEHHGEIRVPVEHPAVEERDDEVLGDVDALRVGEAGERRDATAALTIPPDVGPTAEVRRGVADVDDRNHAEPVAADQTTSQSGWPGGVPCGGRPFTV